MQPNDGLLQEDNQDNILCFEFYIERLSDVYRNICQFVKIPVSNFFALHVKKLTPWRDLDPPQEFKQLESMVITNRLMEVFMIEWSRNRFFHDKLRYKMGKNMNKKIPSFLSKISVEKFSFFVETSHFKDFKLIKQVEKTLIFEVNGFLSGAILITIETELAEHIKLIPKIFRKIKIEATISELLGYMRFTYRPKKLGKSTLSFIGTPDIVFKASISFGPYRMGLNPPFLCLGETLLKHVMKGFVFPEFASIGIPVTKKNRNTAFGTV